MSKKIITCVLTLAMIFSVFCNPALGYATETENASEDTVNVTLEENTSDTAETLTDETSETVTEEPAEDPEEDQITEEPPAPAPETPKAPTVGTVTGLKVTAVSTSALKLTWKKVKNAKEYHVYRYNANKGKYVHIKTVKGNSFKNTKLRSGKKYFYKVRACVVQGEKHYKGNYSKSASCRTNPYVAKVKNLRGTTVDAQQIKLKWNKVSGADGYQVYRYSKAKKKFVLFKTVKTTAYTNKSLKSDTLYSYKVRAYNKQDGKTFYGPFSAVVKKRTEKTDREKIGALAYTKLGSPYKWGAKGPKSFDCSGFVCWVYSNADISPDEEVPETNSSGMYSALKDQLIGSSIDSLDKAKMGDIIFFKYGGRISHVGLYYKDGKMIHAANPKKDVCIEDVSDYNKWGYKVVGIASIL